MAPDHDNTDEPSDEPPDNQADQRRGLLEQVRAIIEALAEIEEEESGHRRASGQIDRGSTRIDYNYDVSIGLGLDDRTASPREQSPADRSPPTAPPTQREATDATHIEKREITDDELVVIADLPGIHDDDLDVTLDTDEPALKLVAAGNVIERIPLDHPNMTITDVSLNNQILEIRLTRSADPSGGEIE